jgi:hypothetical protein
MVQYTGTLQIFCAFVNSYKYVLTANTIPFSVFLARFYEQNSAFTIHYIIVPHEFSGLIHVSQNPGRLGKK